VNAPGLITDAVIVVKTMSSGVRVPEVGSPDRRAAENVAP